MLFISFIPGIFVYINKLFTCLFGCTGHVNVLDVHVHLCFPWDLALFLDP